MDQTTQDARDQVFLLLVGGAIASAILGFVLAVTWPSAGDQLGVGHVLVAVLLGLAGLVALTGAVGYGVSLGVRASGRLEDTPPREVREPRPGPERRLGGDGYLRPTSSPAPTDPSSGAR